MNNDKYYELAKELNLIEDDDSKCSVCDNSVKYNDEYRQNLNKKDADILFLVRQTRELQDKLNDADKILSEREDDYRRIYYRCEEEDNRITLLEKIIDKLTEKNEETLKKA